MPRPAKLYLHRGWWVTNISGIRHKLCREEEGRDAARDAFDELRQESRQNGGRSFPELRITELIALFLDTVKVEKSYHTYLDYQRWLTEFAKLHGHGPARLGESTDRMPLPSVTLSPPVPTPLAE